MRYLVICLLGIFSINSWSDAPSSSFIANGPDAWKKKSFAGQTDYQFIIQDDMHVIKAVSEASASGLYREKKIDLDETPFLNWRWKVTNRLDPGNEKEKSGDDYAARVYVIIDGGILFWRTRALNYVWAAKEPRGNSWNNAFAGNNVRMLALRSRDDALSVWKNEKRNVKEDLQQQFGKDIRYIDAVAIMTDTDNTGSRATAYYSGIGFTSD